ncbi:PP2C family protein-serine/threonine phosphatase [Streptomyces syringium]|uniref:PP2C family protein-serine/threonine phosphatase n=1 Tax=Streptomyces syringium TaxID=76729 RepID=UPI003454F269
MTAPHLPKVAGIDSPVPAPAHTSAPAAPSPLAGENTGPAPTTAALPAPATGPPGEPPLSPLALNALVQDRLAGWIYDLTTLQELTERLARTGTLDDALHELLRAGSTLVGARRGLVTLRPDDGLAPPVTVGLGLGRSDLGHIETIPRPASSAPPSPGAPPSYGQLLDDLPPVGNRSGTAHPDIAGEDGLDPRYREVAARLGYAASYAVPLESDPPGPPAGPEDATGRLGAAVWLYDEPAEPTERQRHLIGLYCGYATEHLARLVELTRARETIATLREELLPSRLPRVAGVRLAVRHRPGPRGGGAWYDALPLPEGALGLAVGGITGSGPSAVAAMGRLRASLRAYAVMEGEDPVAVLSDLELLLRLTEPARAATALFAYCETVEDPLTGDRARKVVLAGAGHCPPLIIGDHRTEYVETSLSAPLGMLACWEAPSVEIEPAPGETLLFYSDGLLHRTGEAMDRAFTRLHKAAASVPRALRHDPEAIADHILRAVLPPERPAESLAGTAGADAERDRAAAGALTAAAAATAGDSGEDVILLVAHFE